MVKTVKEQIENTKKKLRNTKEKINSLDFDAHWYRRVFHTFGASFLVYYLLPDYDWINFLKPMVLTAIVVLIIILETLRINGFVSSDHFFGLRMYEKKRIGSYVFFAIGILLLLAFFPQPIAVPCILCASIGDPIMGEIRLRFNKRQTYILGFFVCLFFFLFSWYTTEWFLMIVASLIGAFFAVLGEIKKFWWIDDDLMIQILPAVLLLIFWNIVIYLGFNLPSNIIHPISISNGL